MVFLAELEPFVVPVVPSLVELLPVSVVEAVAVQAVSIVVEVVANCLEPESYPKH